MTLTPAFADALQFMCEHHGDQVRKDLAGTPYVAHLMSVAALVMEHGGNEDDGIAGLLHDTIEDAGGVEIEAVIAERFGPEVARIVRAVSDTDQMPKPPWRERKQAYLDHLATADLRALRVSAADKLHNARALYADYVRDGEVLWDRFSAGREDQLWIYGEYGAAFERRLAELGQSEGSTAELVATLQLTVAQLAEAVAASGAAGR
ncbi:MAG: HD domain-containing protein [Solirubrobacteraceae bacterium]|nr:HD domain-containing protein [Solirubrobacteraceae bacterium]